LTGKSSIPIQLYSSKRDGAAAKKPTTKNSQLPVPLWALPPFETGTLNQRGNRRGIQAV